MAENGWLKTPFSLKNKKIWVAGHAGMVGSALCRRLAREVCEILTVPRAALDLRDQSAVRSWLGRHSPDVVVMAAAHVGGILANDRYPADFLYNNLIMEANVVHAAYETGVEKLLFLGSSCIYPKEAPQPISPDFLLSGPLEPTNQWYATAKIAGIKLCQAYRRQHGCGFISAMPCNLYGPGDRFDPECGHVIPALMMKAHMAKTNGNPIFTVWGSGRPRREFLHVEDLADALVFLLRRYAGENPVNVGSGYDIAIAGLAALIKKVVGFDGEIVFDPSKPDGVMCKRMDSAHLYAQGWKPSITLEEGLAGLYAWYLDHGAVRDEIA